MTWLNRAIALPVLIALLAISVRAAETVPTAEEAHQQFTDAKYKEAIHTLSKIIASRDWQAKKFNQYELLNLKAESHLRLKESGLAATTFEAASKVAPDKASAAMARTMSYLIKHCVGTNYVPKATANKRIPGKSVDERVTIDIIDPDKRKEALDALWTDEKNVADPKLKLGTDGQSPQSTLDATAVIIHLRDFDFAAHGNDNEMTQTATIVVAHARDLLSTMIEKMGIRVDVIAPKAAKIESTKIGQQSIWRRHGLENKEPQELKDIITNTDKIGVAVKILTDGLNPEKDFFAPVLKDIKRIHKKAEDTLNKDYSETWNYRPPRE